jgi:competence protein ComEC
VDGPAVPVLARLPLWLPAAGWLAGLLLTRTDAVSIPVAVTLAVAGLVPGLHRPLRPFALALAAGLAWGGTSLMWDAYRLHVDPAWMVGTQRITAEIAEVRSDPTHRLLRLTHVRRADGAVLSASIQAALYGQGPPLSPGMRIAASGRWHLPRNAGNPGAFDNRAYCFDHGIALVGSLRGQPRVIADPVSWLQRLRRRVSAALSGLPDARQGVLRSLLLADRSRMPATVQDDFAATGTAHLLAISGLHISMVAAWGFLLGWWLLTRREAWIVALPVRRLALMAGCIMACAYATLAGWPLPAQRAAMMLAAVAVAWMGRRHAEPLNTLLAALMLILVLDPAAVASLSLWLSFAATAGILCMLGGRSGDGLGGRALGMLAVTAVASLATLPIIVAAFGRLPLYTLPANLVAVPLYTGLILPLSLVGELLALAGATAWASHVFVLAGMLVDACGHLLATLHGWPGGKLWVPDPPVVSGLGYVLGMGMAAVLWWRHRRRFGMGLLAVTLLAWGWAVVPERPPGSTEWLAWDVGQGAASSLITPGGKVLVMDVPGPVGSRHNGGTKVAAGLRALGLAHVDVLALSHAQADHMGGAERLLAQERRVAALWLADVPANHAHPALTRLVRRVEAGGGRVRWLARGDHLGFADWDVRVLWPPRGFAPSSANDTSLVLSVGHAGFGRLLWPGDAEAEAERAMLAGGIGRHRAMLMPHHGSRTSSTPAFVDAVHPALAIAQTGVHNRFGFPKPAVLRRYLAIGARVWNTAHGAVIVRWAGDGAVRTRQFQGPSPGRRDRALQWWQGAL